MADKDIALMAHLMRRAGFGATYEELEARVAKGYEATVEELLNPDTQPPIERDVLMRYQPQWVSQAGLEGQQEEWTFRMINTKRPLEEKIALFWHQIFCTGHAKCEYPRQQQIEFDMFRTTGMGNFQELLMGLATDPAMVFYLDNCMSHKDAINENWGRELLELFSMGVGMDGQANYSEEDVKECARAFTGWTVTNSIPRYPYGKYEAAFIYDPSDHDYGEKTFLGETGNWNGEDIVRIVARQPGAARFIARHLYNFFVADEPQVPAWTIEPARDEEALVMMCNVFEESGYEIGEVIRFMLKSEFFKNARYSKIKSPAEVVASTIKMVGIYQFPDPGLAKICREPGYMGQDILDPPSVEGWHTGSEWINSGSLLARINFVADSVTRTDQPGMRSIIGNIQAENATTPEELLNACLDYMGFLELSAETRAQLSEHANAGGNLDWSDEEGAATRIGEMMALISATTEYQFA